MVESCQEPVGSEWIGDRKSEVIRALASPRATFSLWRMAGTWSSVSVKPNMMRLLTDAVPGRATFRSTTVFIVEPGTGEYIGGFEEL